MIDDGDNVVGGGPPDTPGEANAAADALIADYAFEDTIDLDGLFDVLGAAENAGDRVSADEVELPPVQDVATDSLAGVTDIDSGDFAIVLQDYIAALPINPDDGSVV